jgi:uncharacterized membrane protein YukC
MSILSKTDHDISRYTGVGLIIAAILFAIVWYYFGSDILGSGMSTVAP